VLFDVSSNRFAPAFMKLAVHVPSVAHRRSLLFLPLLDTTGRTTAMARRRSDCEQCCREG